ncbi:response regulator transcription factor [Flavobacterium algicola]|uniref:response regulator transcription factor n=1 Tax=Flavobacterium algicola TaxID=556529 RepID=UPI001EFD4B86|nr:response regulator transcription factor [Flavobacterium algicola]MCG9791652.1 response regulator transcription factor [Flavobacterium algicola]
MKKSIVIVDDHLLIAKALQEIINKFENFEILYVCENGKELQDKFEKEANYPAIVMLDISMPIMNGFETALWLKENHPEVLVMALSMQDDEDSLLKMIQNGAKSFLLKNVHPNELENSLNKLVYHGCYYPDWVTNKVFATLSQAKTEVTSSIKISDREMEFLAYTTLELNYKEIADKMNCSPRTVEGYRDALFEKFEVKSRVGLAIYAIKNGLV